MVDRERFYVGTVSEFPHLKVFEENWADAYQSILALIEDFYIQARENGESFPEPVETAADYSGRITVRIPRWLHGRLDQQAEQQGVSLNFHISTLLAEGSSWLEKVGNMKGVKAFSPKAPPSIGRK